MNQRDLTATQADALRLIVHYLGKNGRPPTFRKLGALRDHVSPNAAQTTLGYLLKKGYLERMVDGVYVPRGCRLTRRRLVLSDTPDGWRLADVLVGSYTLGNYRPCHDCHRLMQRHSPHALCGVCRVALEMRKPRVARPPPLRENHSLACEDRILHLQARATARLPLFALDGHGAPPVFAGSEDA